MLCPPKEEVSDFLKQISIFENNVYIRHEITCELRRLTPKEIEIFHAYQRELAERRGKPHTDKHLYKF